MENKNKHNVKLELVKQLLGVVNSQEEFDCLRAEEIQLSYSHIYTGERRYSN